MRKLFTIVAAAAILGGTVAYAVTVTHSSKASASTLPMTCTINHWIHDYSQAGTPLVAVDPADNDQLIDSSAGSGLAAYPANFIFKLCEQGGLFSLENQIPSGVTHLWVAETTGLSDAVTASANGPGTWEQFAILFAGVNHEWLVFQANDGEMFTVVGGGPGAPVGPTMWRKVGRDRVRDLGCVH